MHAAKWNKIKWNGDLPDRETKSIKDLLARGKRSKKMMQGNGKRSFEITLITREMRESAKKAQI